MNGGEVLVATLLSRGVDTVFFVPGGTLTTVMKALSDNRNRIRAVGTRLESSAGFAADAYAAIRGKPACVLVGRAPGATNAAIGVHNAMQASRPMVLFIGDIPRAHKQREAFQEVDYRQMFAPVAKAVFDVNSLDVLAEIAARAIDLSMAGRPGPVVVSVSRDIFDGPTGEPAIPRPVQPPRLGVDASAVTEAARLLDAAEHPILIAGEMVGFERATDALVALAEASGAGVMAAYRQQDCFPNDHPAYMGHLALNRPPYLMDALAQSDMLLSVGSRFDSVTTGDYKMIRRDQRLVMIHPDPAVFAQWQADIAMAAPCGAALAALKDALRAAPSRERLGWRDRVHAAELAFAEPGEIAAHGEVDMGRVVQTFRAMVPPETVVAADAGTFGRWLHRYCRFNHPATNLGPVSGSMGYGVPAGLGAAVADPSRPVVVWAGDGGFLMTGHEMAVLAQENLPVKVIVCDNAAWGSILVSQGKRFPEWQYGTLLRSPDFAMLGRGYGVSSFTVAATAEFAPALAAAMAHEGPALIHLKLDARDVSPFTGSAR